MKPIADANADLVKWLAENDLPQHDSIWVGKSWQTSVRRNLMRWFRKDARDLPWRQDGSPYGIWISEIMLQQTQVATVIEYYQRFMKSFPAVSDLAAASEQTVLSHWEGLGYYRRARSLHAAARKIMDEHGGEFPTTYPEVLALPGIGRYTAGAILSISMGKRFPILEGNTQRVFSRWIASRAPVTDRSAIQLLWKVAEATLPQRSPGTYNQAAMELGALICRPTAPHCDRCPVSKQCQAKQSGIQLEIPGKVKQLTYLDRMEYAFVINEKSDPNSDSPQRYLVRLLPEGGRWAGLWDFPRSTGQDHRNVRDASGGIKAEIGLEVIPGDRLMIIKHAVTRFRIKLNVHLAEGHFIRRSASSSPGPWRYASLEEMGELPMSVTGRKIARKLQLMHDKEAS